GSESLMPAEWPYATHAKWIYSSLPWWRTIWHLRQRCIFAHELEGRETRRRTSVASNYEFWRYLVWPQLAGAVFLLVGLVAIRRRLSFNLEDISVLGRVFVPVPLAVFGAEHFVSANAMKNMVPNWIPGHLFWIYFVGCALFAAAISILTMKYVRLSASLLGLMLFLFVLLLHVPNLIAHPGNRFAWAVATRDFSFALGAWTLAATQLAETGSDAGRRAV